MQNVCFATELVGHRVYSTFSAYNRPPQTCANVLRYWWCAFLHCTGAMWLNGEREVLFGEHLLSPGNWAIRPCAFLSHRDKVVPLHLAALVSPLDKKARMRTYIVPGFLFKSGPEHIFSFEGNSLSWNGTCNIFYTEYQRDVILSSFVHLETMIKLNKGALSSGWTNPTAACAACLQVCYRALNSARTRAT